MERNFTDLNPFAATGAPIAVLYGNIMRRGWSAKAGSKILENFISPFDATVVSRLLENGISISGISAMNEFGLPSFMSGASEDIFDAVKTVAEGNASFALCNDVFGTYRAQAPELGVCYLHPTYGTVSRYGLIPLACSMDQIGIACKTPADCFEVLSVISGNDPKDGAMFPEKHYAYQKLEMKLTAGIPANVLGRMERSARENLVGFSSVFNTSDIELKHFDVYKQVMYILSCAEIASNLMRYDGIKFGYRASGYKSLNELYTSTRTEALGLEAKLTAILGFMVLSKENYSPFYEKAMKIRRLIKEFLPFTECDIIVLPTRISSDPYENLSLYALAPLAGLPSISFSFKGYGIQLVAGVKKESVLLTALEMVL